VAFNAQKVIITKWTIKHTWICTTVQKCGVSEIVLDTFISNDALNLSKVIKGIISISYKSCFLFFSSNNLGKKCILVYTKNMKQHNCFQHWWKYIFLQQQISILEWFLKDHTEDWSNDAENIWSFLFVFFSQSNILRLKVKLIIL